MEGQTCVFTTLSYSQLATGNVLAHTLKKCHPAWVRYAVIVDEPPPGLDARVALSGFDHSIEASFLHIPSFRSWLFQHDVYEACGGVIARVLIELLDVGFTSIIYLAPHTAAFHGFSKIERLLEKHSVILTTRLAMPAPISLGMLAAEKDILNSGIYSSSFLALRNDAFSRTFAAWWNERLIPPSYSYAEKSHRYNRSYLDLAASLFEFIHIERSIGLSPALHRYQERNLDFNNGNVSLNSEPVAYFDFGNPSCAQVFSKDLFDGDDNVMFEVLCWYERVVAREKLAFVPEGYWAFNRFSNGFPVTKEIRQYYRERTNLIEYFDDPFEAHDNSLFNFIRRNQPDLVTS